MKQLTEGQHYLMEVILEAGRPVTVREFIDECLPVHEHPPEATIRRRFDKLAQLGWLTKRDRPTGQRGKPPLQYEPVNGSSAAWTKREAELRAAWTEQDRLDSELLA